MCMLARALAAGIHKVWVKMSLAAIKPAFLATVIARLIQSHQLQRLARNLKLEASLDMILFSKRITKAQIPKTGFLASRPK